MDRTKQSLNEWVGDIPENWEEKPIRYIFNEIKEKNKLGTVTQALKFTYGTIIPKTNFDAEEDNYVANTILTYTIVSPGTIMINCLNLNYDFVSQRIGLVKDNGVITSAYLPIKPIDEDIIDSEYANYQLKAWDNVKAFHNMGSGVRKTLDFTELGKKYILLPPINIQKQIVRFLNKKCFEINTLYSEIERQIEILEEYKKSVITEAVTKGLNSDVKMKDSGNFFIGEIPEHWNLNKMNRVCNIITDYVASGSFAALAENVTYLDYPDYAMLIRTADISGKGHTSQPVYIDENSYNFLSNSNLFGGEIVLPNIGASVGDVYIVPKLYERMSLAPNSIMFKTNQNDMFYYYFFASNAGRKMLLDIAQSTAQAKFNKTELRQMKVPEPTLAEQDEIVEYLDSKCIEVDGAIEDKKAQLKTLEEYKKSLIYEYVTGKKEVPDNE